MLNGVIFQKDVVSPGRMRRKIHNPRILLMDCPIEYKKGENQTNVEIEKEEDWWALVACLFGSSGVQGAPCQHGSPALPAQVVQAAAAEVDLHDGAPEQELSWLNCRAWGCDLLHCSALLHSQARLHSHAGLHGPAHCTCLLQLCAAHPQSLVQCGRARQPALCS